MSPENLKQLFEQAVINASFNNAQLEQMNPFEMAASKYHIDPITQTTPTKRILNRFLESDEDDVIVFYHMKR